MICYKDRSYCTEDTCANKGECDRYLSPQIQKDAEAWWGNKDYPICTFVNRPECYKEVPHK